MSDSGSGTATSRNSTGALQPLKSDWSCRSRTSVFAYDLIIVAGLIAFGWVYLNHPGWFVVGPGPRPNANTSASPNIDLAIRAMWFGALGGIVISLKGVYDHSCARGEWDDGFTLWHIGRPISGALTGLITLVLLLATNPTTSPIKPIVYTMAFVFGTQEARFFNFLSEVAALVVRVPNETADKAFKVIDIQPNEGKPGGAVLITGGGFTKGATVKIDDKPLGNVVVGKDGKTIVGILPDGSGPVNVTITDPDGHSVLLAGKFRYQS